MAQVGVSVDGVENLRKNLAKLDKGARKEMRKAIVELGKPILAETQELVPVETGALKATGRVSVRAGEKQVTLKILYGDKKDVPYALHQHENLSLKHTVGQAKYVEQVTKTFKFAEELAKRIDLKAAARG